MTTEVDTSARVAQPLIHRWSPTGLYVEGGAAIVAPCMDPSCNAELWQRTSRTVIRGPGMSINGMHLDIEDDSIGGVAKVVCRETAEAYRDYIPLTSGDVVLDIGAHVGIVSIYLTKRYPGIWIYAFEPILSNFERMQRNILANSASNIGVINKAVTADGRNVFLSGNAGNSGGASMLTCLQREFHPEKDIKESVSIADVFTMFKGRCALLKIDCEGAEYEILEAAGTQGLLHRVDRIRGEFHINQTLTQQGKSIDGLIAYCRRFVPEVQVTSCQMGD